MGILLIHQDERSSQENPQRLGRFGVHHIEVLRVISVTETSGVPGDFPPNIPLPFRVSVINGSFDNTHGIAKFRDMPLIQRILAILIEHELIQANTNTGLDKGAFHSRTYN